jgi:hypothetical protein
MKLDAFPQTVQIVVDTPVNVHRSSPIVWFVFINIGASSPHGPVPQPVASLFRA